MNNNKIGKITIVSFFGGSISFLWIICDILDRSYSFIQKIPEEKRWILMLAIILSSLIIAAVIFVILYVNYPLILEVLFNRKTEKEQYSYVTKSDEETFKNIFLSSHLNYILDEMLLLDPIKNMIDNDDYERAFKFGFWSSSVFLRIGNHFIRTINGLYTIYALENWYQEIDTNMKDLKLVYQYTKTRVVINDLGWSLYNLTKQQNKDLKSFLEDNYKLDYYNILRLDNFDNSAFAQKKLIEIKERLIKDKQFSVLICQSLRHLLSMSSLPSYYFLTFSEQFKKYSNIIKSKKDKTIMRANYKFWEVQQKLRSEKNIDELIRELETAKDVMDTYKNALDSNRMVKCFNLIGEICMHLACNSQNNDEAREYHTEAYNYFQKGLIESEKISRYDEYITNCLNIIKVSKLLNHDYEVYVSQGVKVAKLVKNRDMTIEFENLQHVHRVILLRHGESRKNINKIINGVGPLTDKGKTLIEERSNTILHYLSVHKIDFPKICIYGHRKLQVEETVNIITKKIKGAQIFYDDRLKPTYMGVLSEKSEKDVITMNDYIELDRWRNRTIPMKNLNIQDMESPKDFWERAENFVNEIKANECSIIVCTTSIAILITHILLNNKYNSDKYLCIDVPLGGIIHFKRNFDKYEICNRDKQTNISFSEIDNTE